MALITCKDCKKEFSTDAKCCPHCGAQKPCSTFLWYTIIFMALLFAVYQWNGERLTKDAEQRQTARNAPVAASAAPATANTATATPAPSPQAAAPSPPVPVDLKQYQRCKQTEKMVDGLLVHDIAYCWLTPDPDAPKSKMMIIMATLPAFSTEDMRRAWIVSVMGATGYLMREKKTPVSTIITTDSDMVKSRQGFRINAPALAAIREQVFDGRLHGMDALLVPVALDDRMAAPITAIQAEIALIGDAQFACEMFVKKTLHDPDSAEFESFHSFPADGSDGLYHVQVHLRAKNGFNALRQTVVDCKVVKKGSDWIAVHLKEIK